MSRYEDLGFETLCAHGASSDAVGAVRSSRTEPMVVGAAIAGVLGAAIAIRFRGKGAYSAHALDRELRTLLDAEKRGAFIPLVDKSDHEEYEYEDDDEDVEYEDEDVEYEGENEDDKGGVRTASDAHMAGYMRSLGLPFVPGMLPSQLVSPRSPHFEHWRKLFLKFYPWHEDPYFDFPLTYDDMLFLDKVPLGELPAYEVCVDVAYNPTQRRYDRRFCMDSAQQVKKDLKNVPIHVIQSFGRPSLWSSWKYLTDKKKKTISGISNIIDRWPLTRFAFSSACGDLYEEDYATLDAVLKLDPKMQQKVNAKGLAALRRIVAAPPGPAQKEFKKLDPQSFGSWDEMIEAVDAIWDGEDADDLVLRTIAEDASSLHRARDRVAERDWSWATKEFPHEYERGQKLKPALEEVVDQLQALNERGETLFIHGRDGELLYQMLKRRPGVDMSKVKYGITSRALTTLKPKGDKALLDQSAHVQAHRDREYEAYLRRVVPPNAIHIDTGFAGSIPRHLDKAGIPVKQILMVSAEDPSEQIAISKKKLPSYGLREMVLADLEHAAQRLPKPAIRRWGRLGYSEEAPGFWARLAGALGWKKEATS